MSNRQFVKLARGHGDPIYVNPDHVMAILPAPMDSRSKLVFDADVWAAKHDYDGPQVIEVEGSPHELSMRLESRITAVSATVYQGDDR